MMTPEIKQAHDWLNSGDPTLAAKGWVILRKDALGHAPIILPTPAIRFDPDVYRAVRECPDRNAGCGCVLPTCRAGKGNWEDGTQTDLENCLACLGLTLDARE
jgi:hypothetical protein